MDNDGSVNWPGSSLNSTGLSKECRIWEFLLVALMCLLNKVCVLELEITKTCVFLVIFEFL